MAEADLFPEKKLLAGAFAGLAAAIIGAIVWARFLRSSVVSLGTIFL